MSETIDALVDDLMLILGEVVVGPPDLPRKVRRVELALERVRAHQPERSPSNRLGEVGGSSSPVECDERAADRYVGLQAIRDEPEMRRLYRDLARTAAQLRLRVVLHTAIVDHEKLPGEPECRSCARKGTVNKQQYEGHHAVAVYDKARKHGLCRWCYDYARADGVTNGIKGLGALPPIDIIDMRHRVGERAAGLELAKRAREAERRKRKAS